MREAKFIQGKRLYLRPVMKDDANIFQVWINDREVTKFLVVNTPVTMQMQEKWVEDRAVNDTSMVLSIVLNNGTLIGNIAVRDINRVDRTANTGCVIGEKDEWGKGYGREAKMLFLDYLFNTLNLRKINSTAIAFNGRSISYQMKCGAVQEGLKKKQIFQDGQYHDEVVLAVFKEDFEKLWKKESGKFLS
ncbi:hypothetical protein C0584_01690 [Candidatus Parcubacteria bacterium]|nr:MAG: hypothetical protein C0584_01690 [Candidatus Parcubacteria bacterium]